MVRSHLLGMLQNRLILKKRQFTRDVVRRIIICSIYVICLNGKTLIRHLAILCGIHVRHRFNRLGINTRRASCLLNGASCLLNVGQVVLGEFSFERVVLGRVVFGASCPVFWLTPYAVKETRPFSCIAVAAIFTCKSFVLLNLTYFAHFINI